MHIEAQVPAQLVLHDAVAARAAAHRLGVGELPRSPIDIATELKAEATPKQLGGAIDLFALGAPAIAMKRRAANDIAHPHEVRMGDLDTAVDQNDITHR